MHLLLSIELQAISISASILDGTSIAAIASEVVSGEASTSALTSSRTSVASSAVGSAMLG